MFPFINFLLILFRNTQSINPHTDMFTIFIQSKSSIISKYIHFINNIIRFDYLAYNYNYTFILFIYFVLNIFQLCCLVVFWLLCNIILFGAVLIFIQHHIIWWCCDFCATLYYFVLTTYICGEQILIWYCNSYIMLL